MQSSTCYNYHIVLMEFSIMKSHESRLNTQLNCFDYFSLLNAIAFILERVYKAHRSL